MVDHERPCERDERRDDGDGEERDLEDPVAARAAAADAEAAVFIIAELGCVPVPGCKRGELRAKQCGEARQVSNNSTLYAERSVVHLGFVNVLLE